MKTETIVLLSVLPFVLFLLYNFIQSIFYDFKNIKYNSKVEEIIHKRFKDDGVVKKCKGNIITDFYYIDKSYQCDKE